MLSYSSLEQYSIGTFNDKPVYTFKLSSYASVLYDFKLIINNTDAHNIIGFIFDINSNVYDTYTIRLWPDIPFKHVGDRIIYDIGFWFSSSLTPLINMPYINANSYITLYTSVLLQYAIITYTNCTYYGNTLSKFNDNLLAGVNDSAYTYTEQKIYNDEIKLHKSINNIYTIICDTVPSIKPSNIILSSKGNRHTFITTYTNIYIYANTPATLIYKRITNWITTKYSLYKQ